VAAGVLVTWLREDEDDEPVEGATRVRPVVAGEVVTVVDARRPLLLLLPTFVDVDTELLPLFTPVTDELRPPVVVSTPLLFLSEAERPVDEELRLLLFRLVARLLLRLLYEAELLPLYDERPLLLL
jgi:hypothetical protein